MKLKRDTKFAEESSCRFKIGIRILTKLSRALESLKNFHVNELLLSKVYIVWAKKVQRNNLSWHWRVMQNWKKNWLAAWKMTWGILQVFTGALESVKLGTLIRSLQWSCVSWQWRETQKVTKMTQKTDLSF